MQTHSPLAAEPRRALRGTEVAAVVAAVVVAAALTLVLTAEPARVRRLTIHNPSRWELGATLDGGPDRGGGSVPLPVLAARSRTVVPDVVDPGGTWTFRFSVAGVDTTPVTVARTSLRRDGWRLEVPAAVARELQAAGVPPTPP
jgi:hypothetical protein